MTATIANFFLWFTIVFFLDLIMLSAAGIPRKDVKNISPWKLLCPIAGCYYFWKYRIKEK